MWKFASAKSWSKATFVFSLAVAGVSHAADPAPSSTFPRPHEVTMAEEWRPHVGLLAGVTNPEGDQGSFGSYGLEIGYQPVIPFGLGLEFNSTQNDDFKRMDLLARGTYNLGGTIPVIRYSYVGVGLGPVFLSDGAELVAAPIIGFDIPLRELERSSLSLGLNAKYEFISSSVANVFAMSGVLKYWY